jgi:site-specific recombinase XerD
MKTCANDPTPAGARDAAIIALLYGCGLRRAELVALDFGDYIGGKLRVIGKGNKERWAYLANGAARAMGDYLTVRGDAPGPLFWAGRRGGHLVPGDRLTTQAVFVILRSRAKAAGVAELSPHDMRRTFVGDLLDAGADIATVAALAGHANVTTTARYDRRGERAKEQAAGLLPVPYFGRGLV